MDRAIRGLEKITLASGDDKDGRAQEAQEVRWHERPGISPALIPELLPRAIFLKLSDLNIALPPYREIAHSIEMEGTRKQPTGHFRRISSPNSERRLTRDQNGSWVFIFRPCSATQTARGSRKASKTKRAAGSWRNRPRCRRTPFILKRRNFCGFAPKPKGERRKTVVYCVHIETRDITERLKTILGKAGLEAEVLKASKVKAGEREEWIQSFRGDV